MPKAVLFRLTFSFNTRRNSAARKASTRRRTPRRSGVGLGPPVVWSPGFSRWEVRQRRALPITPARRDPCTLRGLKAVG